MKVASGLIVTAAIAVTLLLLLGGLAALLFGLGLAMFGGSGLSTAVLGLFVLACGIVFALKVVRPAWRLAKEE